MPQPSKYVLPDISETAHNVGSNIANIRKKHGLSQKVLAEKAGITQALLSHYETGRLNIPVEVVIQIAISLRVHTDELLGISHQDQLAEVPLRISKRLQRISALSPSKQKTVLQALDLALKAVGTDTPINEAD